MDLECLTNSAWFVSTIRTLQSAGLLGVGGHAALAPGGGVYCDDEIRGTRIPPFPQWAVTPFRANVPLKRAIVLNAEGCIRQCEAYTHEDLFLVRIWIWGDDYELCELVFMNDLITGHTMFHPFVFAPTFTWVSSHGEFDDPQFPRTPASVFVRARLAYSHAEDAARSNLSASGRATTRNRS